MTRSALTASPKPAATASARHAGGFTLLEVLVALVVVALGMSALLETLTQSAQNIAALRVRTVAEWIAMNQLALARLNLNAPPLGDTQGDAQNCANGNWHWQQRVSPVDAVPGLLSITVSVRRTGNAAVNSNSSRTNPSGAAAGQHPGATGQLGPNISLGPTAALGSVSSVAAAGCASVASPGSSLGGPGSLGAAPGSLGAPSTLGGTPALGGPSLGGSSSGGTSSDTADNPASAFAGVALGAGSGGTGSSSSGGSGSGSSSSTANQWLVTLTGFRGNALGAASGESPDWTGSNFAGNNGATGAPNGSASPTVPSPTGSSGGASSSPPLLLHSDDPAP